MTNSSTKVHSCGFFFVVCFKFIKRKLFNTETLSSVCLVLQLPWHLFRPLGTPKLGIYLTQNCLGQGFLPLIYETEELPKTSHSHLHLEDPLARPPCLSLL